MLCGPRTVEIIQKYEALLVHRFNRCLWLNFHKQNWKPVINLHHKYRFWITLHARPPLACTSSSPSQTLQCCYWSCKFGQYLSPPIHSSFSHTDTPSCPNTVDTVHWRLVTSQGALSGLPTGTERYIPHQKKLQKMRSPVHWPCLGLVKTLVSYGHNLLKNVPDFLFSLVRIAHARLLHGIVSSRLGHNTRHGLRVHQPLLVVHIGSVRSLQLEWWVRGEIADVLHTKEGLKMCQTKGESLVTGSKSADSWSVA